MSAEKFTPGPWKWWTSNSWRRLTAHNKRGGDYEREGNVLCPYKSRTDGHPDCDISDADMHLIAAAPELYEALSAIITPEGWDVNEKKWVRAVDALAKARGEAS